jgi:hypothetical protein
MRFARLSLVTVALALTACVKQYEPPTPSDPHAILKFRRRYVKPQGTNLVEILRIDKHRAYKAMTPPIRASVPRTDAVLVNPGQSHLEMIATFSHEVIRFEQESYECGIYPEKRTCYRNVQKQVTVVDRHCKRDLDVFFVEGRSYLVELDSQATRHCTVHCIEQRPTGDGKFESQACRQSAP